MTRRVTRSSTRGAAPVANPPPRGPPSRRDATAGARQGNQVLQVLEDRQVIFPRNGNAQAFAEDQVERMARMESENSELREIVNAQSATIENLQAHIENLEAEIDNLRTAVKPKIGRKGKRLLRR